MFIQLFAKGELLCVLIEKAKSKFLFNSNRKMNRGFWASYVELCSKINIYVEKEKLADLITITSEWKTFMVETITYWKNLFNRQLCVESTSGGQFKQHAVFFKNNINPINPLGAKEDYKKEEDDIVNEEICNEDEIEEEICSLEISDEKKEKNPLITSKDKVIVDEMEMFSDSNYWKNNENLKNVEFVDELMTDYLK